MSNAPGSSSSNPSQGLFGQLASASGNTGQQTTNIFGQNAQKNNTGGGSSLFGAGSSSTLFGNNKPTSGQSSGSTTLFGGNTGGSSSGGFSFGNLGEKKQETSSSLFTGFSTPNKNESAQQQSSSLFGGGSTQATPTTQTGAATPTATKPTFSFGNTSTTPAGPPPTNLFGSLGQNQKNSSSNIFGSNQSSSQSATAQEQGKSSLSFGNKQMSPNPAPAFASSLFSSTTPTSATSDSGKGGESGSQQTPKEGPKFSFGGAGGNTTTQPTSINNTTQTNSSEQQTSKPSFSFPSLPTSGAQSAGQSPGAISASDKPSLFGSTSTSSNIFGGANQAKDNQSSSAAAPSNMFGNLGQKKDSSDQPKPSSTLFGNLNQNKSPSEQSQPATSIFGAPAATKPQEATTTSSSTAPATSTSAPTATSLFSATGNPNKDGNPPNSAEKPTETPSASTTLGASTAGPAPTPQSRLKNKSMDEIITRWASDLAKYQKEFQAQAEKVASWDRMLLENSNAISKLYSKTYQAERDTAEVQKQLSVVENHQDELSHWLDRYEREVDEMMSRQMGQGEGLQGPDQERERTYKVAERVSERLDEMGKDLTSMIEEINDASATISKTSKPDDPLSQIVRILNGHLSQLQLIDQGAAELQARVNAAQRESSRLGSRNGGGAGFGNNDAVDHFYRSYMRRG